MKIALIAIGKTDARYFMEAIDEYKNRLVHGLGENGGHCHFGSQQKL